MYIPTLTYPPTLPPAHTWDHGHGQPPPDRPDTAGPWLDVDTGTLYIPQDR